MVSQRSLTSRSNGNARQPLTAWHYQIAVAQLALAPQAEAETGPELIIVAEVIELIEGCPAFHYKLDATIPTHVEAQLHQCRDSASVNNLVSHTSLPLLGFISVFSCSFILVAVLRSANRI